LTKGLRRVRDVLVSTHWWPQLSLETQSFIRFAYGVSMLGFLLLTLPNARRFFVSERWGGYAKKSRVVDAYQNPVVMPVLYAVWIAACVLLVAGRWTVLAAAVNLLICRDLFIRMRWRGVLRGMGAPGFISYWVGSAVFLLELTSRYAPDVRPLALLALQLDFAVIFFSAGVYKLLAGYRRNYGVDLGLVNPEWGYWWRRYLRVPPDHRLFVGLNQLGWATEIVAAVLMMIPPTRFLGAAIIVLTFAFIATQIRLGLLCEMVIVGAILFFHPGSAGARVVDALFSWVPTSPSSTRTVGWLGTVLTVVLWGYIALLPLAHIGLSANLYLRRALRPRAQRLLEAYTNTFGIIVWRVFSVDVVGFFVKIYRSPRDDSSQRELAAHWGWRHGLRYSSVAEAITVTSLFTTLKYYPSNNDLFVERLLRYARTVRHASDELLVFEYVGVWKEAGRWEFVPTTEYLVDTGAGTVEERVLDSRIAVRAAHEHSPVHEAARPGTYAPAPR
jgi:hypothetical protein